MSSTTATIPTTIDTYTPIPVKLPSTKTAFMSLLRADLLTQWRNRRSVLLVVLIPVLILVSWKGFIPRFGASFVLSNCLAVGLNAIGLMGYPNSIARDREKGIFQRLRVAPAPNWTIMASRLTVQLAMIIILTIMCFLIAYQADHIQLSARAYVIGFFTAFIGGAVYLSLGQTIVGLVKNPETVNAVSRMIYIAFIMIGMFAEFGTMGEVVQKAAVWSPYGAVKTILSTAFNETWTQNSSIALLATIGYTLVFTILGIRWFKWSTR